MVRSLSPVRPSKGFYSFHPEFLFFFRCYSGIWFFLLFHSCCSHVQGIICRVQALCMGSSFPIVYTNWSLVFLLSFGKIFHLVNAGISLYKSNSVYDICRRAKVRLNLQQTKSARLCRRRFNRVSRSCCRLGRRRRFWGNASGRKRAICVGNTPRILRTRRRGGSRYLYGRLHSEIKLCRVVSLFEALACPKIIALLLVKFTQNVYNWSIWL